MWSYVAICYILHCHPNRGWDVSSTAKHAALRAALVEQSGVVIHVWGSKVVVLLFVFGYML